MKQDKKIVLELVESRLRIEELEHKVKVYELEYQNHGMMHLCMPNYRGTMESQAYLSMFQLWHKLGVLRREFSFSNHMCTIVSTARQMCVLTALSDPKCEYVVFIDDDMTFSPDQFLMLERELFDNDLDYISALGFSNSIPTKPCVFGRYDKDRTEENSNTWWHVVTDYPRDQRFECFATGMGMVIIRKRMLDGMRRDKNGDIIEGYQHFLYDGIPNEDIGFCINAREAGYKIWCDSRVKLGHISKDRPLISEETYDSCGKAIEYGGDMARLQFVQGEVDLEPVNGKVKAAKVEPREVFIDLKDWDANIVV